MIKDEIINGVLYSWLIQDETQAVEFINQLPKGQNLDRLILKYLDHLKGEDPAILEGWKNLISDPALREMILE